jgi:hypothetical protein
LSSRLTLICSIYSSLYQNTTLHFKNYQLTTLTNISISNQNKYQHHYWLHQPNQNDIQYTCDSRSCGYTRGSQLKIKENRTINWRKTTYNNNNTNHEWYHFDVQANRSIIAISKKLIGKWERNTRIKRFNLYKADDVYHGMKIPYFATR